MFNFELIKNKLNAKVFFTKLFAKFQKFYFSLSVVTVTVNNVLVNVFEK